jgi:hypothetical protein
VNIHDLAPIMDYIISQELCASMDNADANGDKAVDIQDILWVINTIVGE